MGQENRKEKRSSFDHDKAVELNVDNQRFTIVHMLDISTSGMSCFFNNNPNFRLKIGQIVKIKDYGEYIIRWVRERNITSTVFGLEMC
jgi:hypothetical protein